MKLYDRVKNLLSEKPELRSSDRKLLWEVMVGEGTVNHINGATYSINKNDFLNGVAHESVTRARRKVQENHPELQANTTVRKYREGIEKQKGTHVYRETVKDYEIVIGDDDIARKVYK